MILNDDILNISVDNLCKVEVVNVHIIGCRGSTICDVIRRCVDPVALYNALKRDDLDRIGIIINSAINKLAYDGTKITPTTQKIDNIFYITGKWMAGHQAYFIKLIPYENQL